MKHIKIIVFFLIAFSFMLTKAQEKKIKFKKGTLKICSSKNFEIQGYDGDEVIIESLHEKRNANLSYALMNEVAKSKNYSYSETDNNKLIGQLGKKKAKELGIDSIDGKWKVDYNVTSTTYINDERGNLRKKGNVIFNSFDNNRQKGLKKLGKKNENKDLGIFFTIEQNGEELIFKDNNEERLIMMSNEKYLIKIPNSIKLNWQTNSCSQNEESQNQYIFYNTIASSLSNFSGEVAISSTLNNTKLTDVTGPVSINTIGGNVTVEFDEKSPKYLYSIYSNNGFIDITLPESSDVNIDAIASDIFSDINFNIDEETEENNLQKMKLKLKSGKVKMKLNANLGNIYLRKK